MSKLVTKSDVKNLLRVLTPYNVQNVLFGLTHLDRKPGEGFQASGTAWQGTIEAIMGDYRHFGLVSPETAYENCQWAENDLGMEVLRNDSRYMFYVPVSSFPQNDGNLVIPTPATKTDAEHVLKFVIRHFSYIADLVSDKQNAVRRFQALDADLKAHPAAKRVDSTLSNLEYDLIDEDSYSDDTLSDYADWHTEFENAADLNGFVSAPKALHDLHKLMNPNGVTWNAGSVVFPHSHRDLPKAVRRVQHARTYWFEKNEDSDADEYDPQPVVASDDTNVFNLIEYLIGYIKDAAPQKAGFYKGADVRADYSDVKHDEDEGPAFGDAIGKHPEPKL